MPTLLSQYKANNAVTDNVGGRTLTGSDNVYATGLIGQAFDLTSNSGHTYSGAALVASGDPFTISFWVKVVTQDSDSYVASFAAADLAWRNVPGGGSLVSSGIASLSGPEITDSAWHHIAITYDGTNAKYYLDNSLQNSGADAGVVVGDLLSLANFNSGDGETLLDDLRFYSGAADATQVGLLWNGGAGTEDDPLSAGGGAGAPCVRMGLGIPIGL